MSLLKSAVDFVGSRYLGTFEDFEVAVALRKEFEVKVYGFNLTGDYVI